MSGTNRVGKKTWLDALFLAFEAVMHVYITAYLVSIDASLLSIGYTVFELVMFIRLLKGVYNRRHHRG